MRETMGKPGPKPIQDEFTHLSVSRQRKKQLRNDRDGLCACGKPKMAGSESCKKCLIRKRLENRKRTGCKKKVKGKRGRNLIPLEDDK